MRFLGAHTGAVALHRRCNVPGLDGPGVRPEKDQMMGGKLNWKGANDRARLRDDVRNAPVPVEQARVVDVPEHLDPTAIPKESMYRWSKQTKVSVPVVRHSIARQDPDPNFVRCRICTFDVPLKDHERHLRELHPRQDRSVGGLRNRRTG